MAPSENLLHEVAPGDVPEPTPGLRSVLSYNPDTELREELPALLLNLLGASGGDWLKLSADLKALEVAAAAPLVTSTDVAAPGRMLVGDGMNLVDEAMAGILVREAAPTPTDGWDTLLWWDKTAKLLYGPRGKDVVGEWGVGYDPFRPRPTEYISGEFLAKTVALGTVSTPTAFEYQDYEMSGAWTIDANGITPPMAGNYRVFYGFQLLNNSGFEAVCEGQLLVNGVVPAINGRIFATRFETSRWPTFSISARYQLGAGQPLQLEAWSSAQTYSIANSGGFLIERVGD